MSQPSDYPTKPPSVTSDADSAATGSSQTAPTWPPAPDAGPTPAPPGYEILGELGRGGMGVVYQARQLASGRLVAIKRMLDPLGAAPSVLTRFRAEADALA